MCEEGRGAEGGGLSHLHAWKAVRNTGVQRSTRSLTYIRPQLKWVKSCASPTTQSQPTCSPNSPTTAFFCPNRKSLMDLVKSTSKPHNMTRSALCTLFLGLLAVHAVSAAYCHGKVRSCLENLYPASVEWDDDVWCAYGSVVSFLFLPFFFFLWLKYLLLLLD